MGTNYYWHERAACSACERPFEGLHIGKSSAGWCFSLHVIPEEAINDLPDWEERWNRSGSEIRDEYGDLVTPADLRRTITERQWRRQSESVTPLWYHENSAEPGPKGLARHKVDGLRVIRQGIGTWDCIVGEFS